jgi:hypothetical protein
MVEEEIGVLVMLSFKTSVIFDSLVQISSEDSSSIFFNLPAKTENIGGRSKFQNGTLYGNIPRDVINS